MALHSYKQGEFCDALAEKQRNGFLGSDFLDTRWSGVGAQMADHELEEGEACDDPDSGCDPDTAFAYLDEKLSMVLGDVQKFFEGGVSAEKLGSKFGGYGSFLPTQERTPSILQDKPPTAVVSDAYCRSKKSSNEGLAEKMRRTAAGSSVQASNFKAGSSSPVLMHENRARGAGAVNEKSNNDSSFPEGRVEQNTNLPKRMLLRFKVGSDMNERKKNTTIYSDFGLGNSSSASEDEDEDEDQDSDHYSSPDRTPLTMIRIMTSHHIPDGTLLSPLPDLVVEPFIQKERLWSTNLDGLNEKARSPCSKKVDTKHDLGLVKDDGDAFEKMDISREKVREHTERRGDSAVNSDHVLKRVKVEKDKGGSKDSSRHTSKQPLKTLAKDVPKSIEMVFERQARDAVSESGTGARSIESHKEFNRSSLDKAPPDYSLYEGEHGPKDFCSPFQPPKEIDSGREVLSRGFRSEKATASTSHDSMNEHLDTSHLGRDVGKEVFNTAEINSHAKRHLDVCTEPTDGRKRSSGKEFIVPSEGKTTSSQDAKRVASKSIGVGKGVVPPADVPVTNRGDFGREAPDARKRSKDSVKETDVPRGTSKERGKETSKDARKSSGKEKHIKTNSSKGPVLDETTKGPQPSFKTVASKEIQQVDLPKVQKTENFEHKKKEKSKDRIRSDFKEPPKFSEELATRDVFAKASQPVCVPDAISSDKPFQSAVPPPETGNVGPPYVLVMDNWVACDNCEKWRLLPPGVDEGHLPSQWRCKMLYWLEGMNNCNVLEEVTTKATRALYNIAPPVPPPSQEIPPVVEQVQPPAPAVTSLPPPIVQPSRETKAPEKAKAVGNKKRKIPPITSTDTVVLGKSNASQVIQEANQTKLGGGDTIADQEKTQAKLGAPDAGHVKVGEEKHVKVGDEKRKAKEKEKAKRPRVNDGASPFGKEHNLTPGNLALRDATNLKHTADRFQGSKEGDCTGLYFQAALKFLQAASLLESESSEHGENRQHGERRDKLPLNIYADTATLCDRFCARSYERSKDFAAAALAYKCAGLALMRVVQAKSMSVNKDRAEIQSAHQVAPGESPSSSTALDADAQNNSTMDRAPARGTVSPALTSNAGNSLIIAGKIRPSLHRLLQYVADTSGAIEAWTKASSAYSAAESASVYSPEAMSALKRVLDYGFHDVMSLVQLVRIALEAMGH